MSTDLLKVYVVVEQCRCSICKGYLSCGPIRVLPDGSSICGHCNPANPDVLVSRELVLEKILGIVSFPCRFRPQGCSKQLSFGQTTDHESKCSYRIFGCPTSCSWEGSGLKLYDHFMEEHSELIKENAEIKLRIAESAEGILMLVKGNVTFFMKYFYDCNDNNFKYNIRYHVNDTEYDVSFRISMINDSEPECVVTLKSKKCLVFDDSFHDVQNTTVLNLKKFYESLEYPDSIVISLNLTVTQTNTDVQSLDLLKCPKCCGYLIPPLYNLEEKVVCCDCGKSDSKCTPSKNQELLQRVTEIKFPCRWRNCDFIGKSDIYKTHELSCKFYIHNCLFSNCEYCFILSDAVAHYKNYHKAEYMKDKIVCKTTFSESGDESDHIFTIKQNTVIFLQHAMLSSSDFNTLKMKIFSSNPSIITGSINVEHHHCALTPKPFNFVSRQEISVKLNQLPPCFKKNDVLTVTVIPE